MTTVTVITLNEISAVWAPLLWKASWQGGVALLLILGVSLAMRKIPSHIRCWLWRLAFFKLLIAGLWVVSVPLPFLPPLQPMTFETHEAALESIAYEIPVQGDAATTPRRNLHRRPTPKVGGIPRLSQWSFLLIAWIVGATLVIANLLRHWVRVRKMTSKLDTLTNARVLSSFAENCRQMSVSRQPQLRVSYNSWGPCLTGIMRPVIVLPSIVLEPCNSDELNAALLHELAHIKRRDLFWNWLPALAEAVFFFHPLVWLAKREWRLSQEIATDELALSVSRIPVARYAKSLVELAAKCPTVKTFPHLAVTVSEAYSQLSRRMIAMQTFQTLTPRRRLTMAIVVLVMAAVAVVPWKLTAQESQAQPASGAPVNDQETAKDVGITTSRQRQSEQQRATETKVTNDEKREDFVVEIAFRRDKNGKKTDNVPFIFFGDTAIRPSAIAGAMTDLQQRFKKSGRIPQKVTVVLHADSDVNVEIVRNLFTSLQTAGFEKFALKALRSVENERAVSSSRPKVDDETLEIKIRLKAEADGSLSNLTVGRRSLGNDKDVIEELNAELHKMFDYLDIHPGKNVEMHIEADRNLNFQTLTKTITACSVYLNRKTGKTIKYVQRIKFATPPPAKKSDN